MTDIRNLAEDFSPSDPGVWEDLARQSLRGRDPSESLAKQTYDGIVRQPLYTDADWSGRDDGAGFPGQPDFRRGGRAQGARPWIMCQAHDSPDPAEANAAILRDLERGATATELTIARSSRDGLAVDRLRDLERALEGVYLDAAGLSLDSGERFFEISAILFAYLEKADWPLKKVNIDLNADPLGSLAATGELAYSIEDGLDFLGQLTRHACDAGRGITAATVSISVYHDGGASNVQELSAGLATFVAYLRAMEAAGVQLDAAPDRILFRVSVDADVLGGMAKLRALRRLAGNVLSACGLDDARIPQIHAVTSARMMSRVDPWVNMLRTTIAGFVAATGGADRMTVRPFDAALGPSNSFSRRIARNVQTILAEESFLDRVGDPGGGAYAIECLTDQMAEAAWAGFQRIEEFGGMAAVLEKGTLAEQIDDVWQARRSDIARRRQALTGVSEFPRLDEERPDPPPSDRPDKADDAHDPESSVAGSRTFGDLVAAARDGAGIDELSAAVSGEAERITPIVPHRLAEDFEDLRAASDAFRSRTGQRPCIFLANLGRVAEHTARASFARNMFAAGGIESVGGSGGTEPEQILEQWRESDAPEAVICGSDDLYADHLVPVARSLKDAGVRHLVMAGDPGKHEAVCRDAGVDEFIYTGCNAIDVLREAHRRYGIAGEGL